MISILQKYAANGFADFSGLSVTGKIPVKQELLNELIANFLTTAGSPTTTQPQAPSAIDPKVFLPLVKKAQITADTGVLTLHFELEV